MRPYQQPQPTQQSHPSLSGQSQSQSSFKGNYRNLPDIEARVGKATKLFNAFLLPFGDKIGEESELTEDLIDAFLENKEPWG